MATAAYTVPVSKLAMSAKTIDKLDRFVNENFRT